MLIIIKKKVYISNHKKWPRPCIVESGVVMLMPCHPQILELSPWPRPTAHCPLPTAHCPLPGLGKQSTLLLK